jgi:DNA-binding transcriptional LysR family regulator
MPNLPDFEGLAIFAKTAELRSFARAAEELRLSKATVSKAVSRLETKLGARLFNRSSRRLALTELGRMLVTRAAAILAEAELLESEASSRSLVPRGPIRLAAPMSFGVLRVAPLVPEFLRTCPEVSIDLQLGDAIVDIIGEGFDAALRIGDLPDSSLLARKLCDAPRYLLAAPSYLSAHGEPKHPLELAGHSCFSYAHAAQQETWRFRRKSGETATLRPAGPLRVNNGDAMLPCLVAGLGLGVLPEFIAAKALAEGRLVTVLSDWSLASAVLHWLTPPSGPQPLRVRLLADFLAAKLGPRGKSEPSP